MYLTEKRHTPTPSLNQGKQIYTVRPFAVRLIVCTEVPGAKKISLLPELLFEFALGQLVATFQRDS